MSTKSCWKGYENILWQSSLKRGKQKHPYYTLLKSIISRHQLGFLPGWSIADIGLPLNSEKAYDKVQKEKFRYILIESWKYWWQGLPQVQECHTHFDNSSSYCTSWLLLYWSLNRIRRHDSLHIGFLQCKYTSTILTAESVDETASF